MVEIARDLRVKGTDLWLDSRRRKDFCFISHSHLDHAAKHKKILATAPTVELYRHRRGRVEAVTVAFNERLGVGEVAVTLFSAGHVLGSSQILIEGRTRTVYTGDFKLRQSETAEPIEIKQCDLLIMECTYGHPRYRFPTRDEICDRLEGFVRGNLRRGVTPVVFAYSLGKAQEAMKIIGDYGYELAVDRSVYDIARIYEQFGVEFGPYALLTDDGVRGQVVISTPFGRVRDRLKPIRRLRTVFLTGWAIDGRSEFMSAVDEAIAFSDHADFYDLLEYVKRAKPSMIYTTHGPKEFAGILRSEGFQAEHVLSHQQLRLDL